MPHTLQKRICGTLVMSSIQLQRLYFQVKQQGYLPICRVHLYATFLVLIVAAERSVKLATRIQFLVAGYLF